MSRTVAALLLAAFVIGAAWSGATERAMYGIVIGLFEWLAVDAAASHSTTFLLEGRPFVVSFWCTPTVVWLGSLLLLSISCRSLRGFLVWSVGLAIGATALMATNIVLSVQWYVGGLSWGWAHRPGLVLMYLSAAALALWGPGWLDFLAVAFRRSLFRMRWPSPALSAKKSATQAAQIR